jgi:hypothetical protein
MFTRSSPLPRLPLLLAPAVATLALAFSAAPALAGEDNAPPPPCGTVPAGDDCTPVPTPTPVPPVATPTPAPVVAPAPAPAQPAPLAAKPEASAQQHAAAPRAAKPRVVYVTRTVTVPVAQRIVTVPQGGVAAGAGGTATRAAGIPLLVAGGAGTALLLLLAGLTTRLGVARRP